MREIDIILFELKYLKSLWFFFNYFCVLKFISFVVVYKFCFFSEESKVNVVILIYEIYILNRNGYYC